MKAHHLTYLLGMVDPESEVRIMSQPNWPLEYSVEGAWVSGPQPDACRTCGDRESAGEHHDFSDSPNSHEFEPYNEFTPHGGDAEVLYLTEGRQLGYGTRLAWEEQERP